MNARLQLSPAQSTCHVVQPEQAQSVKRRCFSLPEVLGKQREYYVKRKKRHKILHNLPLTDFEISYASYFSTLGQRKNPDLAVATQTIPLISFR